MAPVPDEAVSVCSAEIALRQRKADLSKGMQQNGSSRIAGTYRYVLYFTGCVFCIIYEEFVCWKELQY